MNKPYIVTWQKVLVTTYEGEAEDEEDVIDDVRNGAGAVVVGLAWTVFKATGRIA